RWGCGLLLVVSMLALFSCYLMRRLKAKDPLRRCVIFASIISLHFASAITCNCTKLRVCSFSRYSRPFLTLTWSHGSTSVISRERCEYHAVSMPRSANVCHHSCG